MASYLPMYCVHLTCIVTMPVNYQAKIYIFFSGENVLRYTLLWNMYPAPTLETRMHIKPTLNLSICKPTPNPTNM